MQLDYGLKADVKWAEDALIRYQFASIEAMHKHSKPKQTRTTRQSSIGFGLEKKKMMATGSRFNNRSSLAHSSRPLLLPTLNFGPQPASNNLASNLCQNPKLFNRSTMVGFGGLISTIDNQQRTQSTLRKQPLVPSDLLSPPVMRVIATSSSRVMAAAAIEQPLYKGPSWNHQRRSTQSSFLAKTSLTPVAGAPTPSTITTTTGGQQQGLQSNKATSSTRMTASPLEFQAHE